MPLIIQPRILAASLVVLILSVVQAVSQINYFNFFRPYQTTLCCPVNVYGLGIEMDYLLVDANTARLDIPVSLYWGLLGNLEVGLKVAGASVSRQAGEATRGFTDMVLGGKYSFLRQAPGEPYPAISVEGCVTFPTGDYRQDFGTGALGLVANVLLEKEIVLKSERYFNAFMNLGYRANSENSDHVRFGDELLYGLGSFFPLSEDFVFSFGLKAITHTDGSTSAGRVPGYSESYLFAGLSYDISFYQRFFAAAALGIDERSSDIVLNIGMMY